MAVLNSETPKALKRRVNEGEEMAPFGPLAQRDADEAEERNRCAEERKKDARAGKHGGHPVTGLSLVMELSVEDGCAAFAWVAATTGENLAGAFPSKTATARLVDGHRFNHRMVRGFHDTRRGREGGRDVSFASRDAGGRPCPGWAKAEVWPAEMG